MTEKNEIKTIKKRLYLRLNVDIYANFRLNSKIHKSYL